MIISERKGWSMLRGIGLMLIGIVLWSACQQDEDTSLRTPPHNLADTPSAHVGETVVISGEMNRVFSARAFTVGGEDFGQGLLFVSADPIAKVRGPTADVPLAERDFVQVTGIVQRLDPSTFADEVGVELPDPVATEFRNEPVVVALQSNQAMHGIEVSPQLGADTAATVNELGMATNSSEQNHLRGRVAALPSAPLQEVVRDRMFWIRTGEKDRVLVVANPESTPGLQKENAQPRVGEEWMLHGIFRELPREGLLRTQWDASEDLISELDDHDVYLHAIEAAPVNERDS